MSSKKGTHDTTAKSWPGVRPRIISMAICQTSICRPHDLLKLPEFGEETRKFIVDLGCIGWH
jgi:hypothetical protein